MSLLLPQSMLNALDAVRLPAVPQVLNRFLAMVEDETIPGHELATIAALDPALAARLLDAANAQRVNGQQPVATVHAAIPRLGRRVVHTIATCLALQEVFDRMARGVKYDLTGYWLHSLLTAELAKRLASGMAGCSEDDAYLAGLFHDIGLLLLAFGSPEYLELLANSADESVLLGLENDRQKETRSVCSHAALGAAFVDRWQLDSLVADAILFHHSTFEQIQSLDGLSRILWVAHQCAQLAVGSEQDAPLSQWETLLGLRSVTLLTALEASRASVLEHSRALGLQTLELRPAQTLPRVTSVIASTKPFSGTPGTVDAAIHDAALLRPLQRALGGEGEAADVYAALRQSANILFDLPDMLILLADESGHKLAAPDVAAQSARASQIVLHASPASVNIAALALSAQGIQKMFLGQDDLPLADLQLIRLMGNEGVLCVPLQNREHVVGVMLFAITLSAFQRLESRLPWLENFGRLVAVSLSELHAIQQRKTSIESAMTEQFKIRSRKIAHEAGNPLGIIKNYLAILERKLPPGTDVHRELSIIGEEIDRVNNIVRSMSDMPISVAASRGTDLNSVIREMQSLYQVSLFEPKGIRLDVELTNEPLLLLTDAAAVKQIVLNLWKNAAEALRNGDRVTVTTQANILDQGSRYAEIRIDDTGPGMSQEVLSRLMQPKQGPDSARGWGLVIVNDLITRHNGRLLCRSRLGKGTTFQVLLPVANAQ